MSHSIAIKLAALTAVIVFGITAIVVMLSSTPLPVQSFAESLSTNVTEQAEPASASLK